MAKRPPKNRRQAARGRKAPRRSAVQAEHQAAIARIVEGVQADAERARAAADALAEHAMAAAEPPAPKRSRKPRDYAAERASREKLHRLRAAAEGREYSHSAARGHAAKRNKAGVLESESVRRRRVEAERAEAAEREGRHVLTSSQKAAIARFARAQAAKGPPGELDPDDAAGQAREAFQRLGWQAFADIRAEAAELRRQYREAGQPSSTLGKGVPNPRAVLGATRWGELVRRRGLDADTAFLMFYH